MIQPGGFLGRLLGKLLKTGLPLMENVIKPLAKSALIPFSLTATAGSGTTTLIISKDKVEDIIKIVKSLEDSGLLFKQFRMKQNNKKKDFLVFY